MIKMGKKLGIAFTTALIATAVMTGCKDKSGEATSKPAAATKTEKKVALFPEWKPEEVLKKIQGTYKVGYSTWEVKGEKVKVTSKNKTKEATLDLTEPCAVKVVVTNDRGSSWDNFGIALNGDDAYIGMGTYGMKYGDKYIVNRDGIVTFDGKECNYYEEKGFGKEGYKAPIKIKGEVGDKNGKKMFTFDVPNRYKEGEFNSYSIEIVGDALLNYQAKGNLIKR